MRLAEVRRTTSFRLALLFLMLFGSASLALFGFLYWETNNYLTSRVDDWLVREQASFIHMGRQATLNRLVAHVIADPIQERPFILFNASGEPLAGPPLDLPAAAVTGMPRDQPVRFSVQRDGTDIAFRGMFHRTPSGELLLIAQDMKQAREFGVILVDVFVWGGLVTMLLGLAGAVITGIDAVRRIDGVTRAIERIVSGDLSERLPARGRSSDLDRLVHVINGMLAELERLMQEVKGVCDNIAHDLRTPLTRLLAGLERIRRRADSIETYKAGVDEAIVETKSVLTTFAAMLRISEVESGARRAGFEMVDLSEVVADAVELYEPVAEEKDVTLELASGHGAAAMRGDPNLLFEAVGNLVDNALKFTPPGGRVTVRGFAAAGLVGVEVTDTGPGIPADEREAVLRRFYRTEASRHEAGSGLGLALVAAVAQLHGMDLVIRDASPGCGISMTRREVAGA